MSIAKISDMTATTTPVIGDLVELEVVATPASRKCTLENLFHAIAATLTKKGTVLKAAAVADLALTVTNPPTQAEVQAIHDKLNALMGSLRTAGILNT